MIMGAICKHTKVWQLYVSQGFDDNVCNYMDTVVSVDRQRFGCIYNLGQRVLIVSKWWLKFMIAEHDLRSPG